MQHQCIKPICGQSYKSEELEAYYCPSCTEKNKQIAEDVSKRIRPIKVESTMKKYDSLQKVHGFPRASDLI